MSLIITVDVNEDKSFSVFRQLSDECYFCQNSVFTIKDYKWTPWNRQGGNLLW